MLVYSLFNRLSRWWNRELEGGLPDSRLSPSNRRSTTIRIGNMMYERVFCANCGRHGGAVTAEFSPHVFYLCDDCAYRENPPGVIEVPPPPGTFFVPR